MLAGRMPSSRHCGSTNFAQLIMKSTKHRKTGLKISRENPVFNITVFKDVKTNPGPSNPRILNFRRLSIHLVYISIRAGMVGAVGKVFAFRPQGPQFDPGSAEIRIFVLPSFPPKPTQLSILPGG